MKGLISRLIIIIAVLILAIGVFFAFVSFQYPGRDGILSASVSYPFAFPKKRKSKKVSQTVVTIMDTGSYQPGTGAEFIGNRSQYQGNCRVNIYFCPQQ